MRMGRTKGGPGYEKTAHLGFENGTKINAKRYKNLKGFRMLFHGTF